MRSVGLIHTGSSLAASFDALIRGERPDVQRLHIVDDWLLTTATRDGLTDSVHLRVREHVRYLAGVGASAVLVTCPTIGETADSAAHRVAIPVLRVDLAMATEAAAIATSLHAFGRVAVLGRTEPALVPTARLVHQAAAALGAPVTVSSHLVSRLDALPAAIRCAALEADVVVLAEAGMAEYAVGADLRVPVLTSPDGGVRTLLSVVPERRRLVAPAT